MHYFCFLAIQKALNTTVHNEKVVEETAAMKLSGSRPYVYFKVKSPLRIPITTKNPFNVTLSVHGLQPIKIQWQKDQHELMIGSRYKTFENGRRLLVEPPYTVEDSGTYSASACNSKGCGARGFQVIFYGKYQSYGRRIGLTVTGSSGPGSSPGWVCVMFSGKTLLPSQCLSPLRSISGRYRRIVMAT